MAHPPFAIVTLITSDRYLPGALTVAAALKEVHPYPPAYPEVEYTTVCLVTPETVDVNTIRHLRNAFDVVIGVEVIEQDTFAELRLLGRLDLHSVLTKLHIFRLTQYSKIIFLDADVLPLQPLSHLFNLPYEFAAVPDVGWPDIFNSGVMVLSPGEDKFNELRDLLKSKGSWDGGDQGILNEWRNGNWHRLSFTYNTTPTATYTYAPAYARFGSQIKAIHFIGSNKPWDAIPYRAPSSKSQGQTLGDQPAEPTYGYSNLVDRWFDVYDRHYRQPPSKGDQFEVRRYENAWNERPTKGSQPTPQGAPFSLEELRQLALDGMRSAGHKASQSLSDGSGYLSMPLEGRISLMRPQRQDAQQESSAGDESGGTNQPVAARSPPGLHIPQGPTHTSPPTSPPTRSPRRRKRTRQPTPQSPLSPVASTSQTVPRQSPPRIRGPHPPSHPPHSPLRERAQPHSQPAPGSHSTPTSQPPGRTVPRPPTPRVQPQPQQTAVQHHAQQTSTPIAQSSHQHLHTIALPSPQPHIPVGLPGLPVQHVQHVLVQPLYSQTTLPLLPSPVDLDPVHHHQSQPSFSSQASARDATASSVAHPRQAQRQTGVHHTPQPPQPVGTRQLPSSPVHTFHQPTQTAVPITLAAFQSDANAPALTHWHEGMGPRAVDEPVVVIHHPVIHGIHDEYPPWDGIKEEEVQGVIQDLGWEGGDVSYDDSAHDQSYGDEEDDSEGEYDEDDGEYEHHEEHHEPKDDQSQWHVGSQPQPHHDVRAPPTHHIHPLPSTPPPQPAPPAPPLRSPSPPLIAWNPAVEPPPKVAPLPTAFPVDAYFPNVWDLTSSSAKFQSSVTGEPRQDAKAFFESPLQHKIPQQLLAEGHYRNVMGPPVNNGNVQPIPDKTRITAIFPWETTPRHAPARKFPDSEARPPGLVYIEELPPPPPPEPPKPKEPEVKARPAPPPVPVGPVSFPSTVSYTNAWDEVPSIQKYAERLVKPQFRPPPQFSPVIPRSIRKRGDSFRSWEEKVEASSMDGDDEDEGEEDEADNRSISSERSDGGKRSGTVPTSGAKSPPGRSSAAVPTSGKKEYRSYGVQTVPKEVRSQGVQVNTIVAGRGSVGTSGHHSKMSPTGLFTLKPIPRRTSRTSPTKTGVLDMPFPRSFEEMKVEQEQNVVTSPTTVPTAAFPRSSRTVPTLQSFPSGAMSPRVNDTGTFNSPRSGSPPGPTMMTVGGTRPPSLGFIASPGSIARTPSLDTVESPVGPVSPTDPPALQSSSSRKASRTWNPATGVDVFKRSSEQVLARFLRMGSWDE